MRSEKKILAIIPARSGSVGLRHKNIKKLAGKSLLERAVGLALASRRSGEHWQICVSTDSSYYARLARKAGALTPFIRPAHLATAKAPLWKVVAHCLDAYAREGQVFDTVILLSCSTPLTQVQDVRRALKLQQKSGQSVASVVAEKGGLNWRFAIKNKQLQSLDSSPVGRRQAAAELFRINGAIYVASPAWLKEHRYFIVDGLTRALKMPECRSLDIEGALELKIAEILWSQAS
ncbi:MAG: acylneuraminate cytidylyltransferase family protein [Myxococcota bacterium]|jgi:CMP-N-acetylneuraminic acid synthetase|nr:acylneuraminate cytidylyltransferase family protein [Myxococcota bacterium]